jgi:hypothetical protein
MPQQALGVKMTSGFARRAGQRRRALPQQVKYCAGGAPAGCCFGAKVKNLSIRALECSDPGLRSRAEKHHQPAQLYYFPR